MANTLLKYFLASVCLCVAVFAFDDLFDYIETPADEFGNVIGHDRMSELAAMRSTKLGSGSFGSRVQSLGNLDTLFSGSPFTVNGFNPRHHIFKRQAPAPDFAALPKASFGDPFHNDFQTDFHPNVLNFPKSRGTNIPKKPVKVDCNEKPIHCNRAARYRNYDGHCNNLNNPRWGATMQPSARMLDPQYADGIMLPRMYSRVKDRSGRYPILPSPRYVSRSMLLPDEGDDKKLPDISAMFMQWGQFTDHDMTGTPVSKDSAGEDLECCKNIRLSDEYPHHPDVFQGKPCFPIYIPSGDRHFHRNCMEFARSQAEPKKLLCGGGYREQMNMITAYVDASQVYGISYKDSQSLRNFVNGQMKTADNNLLPEDVNATCTKEAPGDYCFKSGDERVNEQSGLTATHTMFMRYHNSLCLTLKRLNPHWDDERLYREARKIVGAILQHITYYEWLPILLGPRFMDQYGLHVSGPNYNPYQAGSWSYDSSMSPDIMNSFASAAMRFGHSLVPSRIKTVNNDNQLREIFNRPKFILQNSGQGMNVICSGLTDIPAQTPDHFFVTDLTDHLFEDEFNKSLDLTALNIQRGRDHGLPPYNDYRKACGLPPIEDYNTLKLNFPSRAKLLSQAYGHVDDIDLFPGGISENPVAGGMVGPTFACILGEQFKRAKYGDRFWYETSDQYAGFTLGQLREIKRVTLARMMCDVLPYGSVQSNVFLQPNDFINPKLPCSHIPNIDYSMWKEHLN